MASLLGWAKKRWETSVVRDLFDANTAADQQRRKAAGQPQWYQDQQAQQQQQPQQQGPTYNPGPNPQQIFQQQQANDAQIQHQIAKNESAKELLKTIETIQKVNEKLNKPKKLTDKEKQIAEYQKKNPAPRMGVWDKIKDNTLEANSTQDIYNRGGQTYREQRAEQGDKRPFINIAQQIGGNTSRFINTALQADQEVRDTIQLLTAQARGDTEDWRNTNERIKLRQQTNYGNPESGLLGTGTIFDSVEDFQDAGALETAKKVSANTVGTAGEVLPIGKGAQAAMKTEAALSKLLPGLSVHGGLTAGASDAGEQYISTGKIDPMRTLTSTVAGAVLAPATAIVSRSLKNLNPLDDAGSLNAKGEGNLFDINDYKKRAKTPTNEPKPIDPLKNINSPAKNKAVEKQLTDLGVSEKIAKKVVKENDNSFIATNLLNNDRLKTKTNPDAYVETVLKRKTGPSLAETKAQLNKGQGKYKAVDQPKGVKTRDKLHNPIVKLDEAPLKKEPKYRLNSDYRYVSESALTKDKKITEILTPSEIKRKAVKQGEETFYIVDNKTGAIVDTNQAFAKGALKKDYKLAYEMYKDDPNVINKSGDFIDKNTGQVLAEAPSEKTLNKYLTEGLEDKKKRISGEIAERKKRPPKTTETAKVETPRVKTKKTTESTSAKVKKLDLDPESVYILDDAKNIVENTGGEKAKLVEMPISEFGNPKFETLNQSKYTAGRKVRSPIEAEYYKGELTITDGANRFTQAKANGDKTIPVVLNDSGKPKAKPIKKLPPGTETKKPKGSIFDRNLEAANQKARKVIDDIDAEVRKKGYDPNEVRRKMLDAEKNRTTLPKDLEEVADLYTKRLDQARDALEKSGVKFEGFRAYYTPRVEKGRIGNITTRDQLLDFGYSKERTYKTPDDKLDVGGAPQVDYIVKGENRGLIVEKATYDAAKVDGRKMSNADVKKASKQTIEFQKKIHKKSKSKGVLNNDTMTELHEIGKTEKYTQTEVDYNPGRVTQSPEKMMERAKTGKTSVYDRGIRQYDNAVGYASEFARSVIDKNIKPSGIYDALAKDMKKIMPNADKSSIQNAVGFAVKTINEQGIDPKNAGHVYARAYLNLAKSEMTKMAKTTKFTNSKMNKVMNEQLNNRLLHDAYNNNAAQNFDQFLAERVNVSLRGLNVVSALFELGDVANIYSNYGVKNARKHKVGLGKIDGKRFAMSEKYGQSNTHFMSDDIPQVSKLDKIWANPNTNIVRKLYETYRTGENKILLFKYVEEMKTELFFRTADDYYRSKDGGSLSGAKLVDKVMQDYYHTMLPNKIATANRIVGKAPKITTQYLNWSLQATKRLGRTVSGTNKAGKFSDMTRAGRIARGTITEIVPKVGIASLLGIPIMQVMGMRDFTGVTEGDFTGIAEEDKQALDHVVEALSISPAVGVAGNFYFADRRNDIADARAKDGENYNAKRRDEDKMSNVAWESAGMLIPFRTQYRKTDQVRKASEKGYYENRDGRIQAEGPKGVEKSFGFVVGKNYTPTFRKYQDNPDALQIATGKGSAKDKIKRIPELFTKNQTTSNVVQYFGKESTNRYKRPIGKDYSELYKKADEGGRKALLKGGRQYNQYLDDLRRDKPDSYNNYIASMDDKVNPEYWKKITSDGDMSTFNMMRNRKIQLKKDMDKAGNNKDHKYDYDPLYDLKPKQAKEVLEMKAVTTGRDIAMRNILYKEKWFNEYQDKVTKYWGNKPEGTDSEYKQTKRVKDWYNYSDKLSKYKIKKNDDGSDPKWAKDYPLVLQSKNIIDKYGFGSDESDAFFKDNYDAYSGQKEEYDKAQLNLINKMRKIEGVGPMSYNQYLQANKIAETKEEKDAKDKENKEKYAKNKYSKYSKKGDGFKKGYLSPYTATSLLKTDKTPRNISVRNLTLAKNGGRTKKFTVKQLPSNYLSKRLG